jgi:gas vesicle protein
VFGIFLTGLVIGAAVALIFAHQSGTETRQVLRDKGEMLKEKAEVLKEKAEVLKEKAQDMRDNMKERWKERRSRAEEAV